MLILQIIDTIIFILVTLCVAYLFFFALMGMKEKLTPYPESKKKNRFLVLFPSYKEDVVIINSVKTFMQQDYPKDCYDVLVISDHMTQETDDTLRSLGAQIIKATYENSSKAKALILAMGEKEKENYNIVAILDADNLVEKTFLNDINNCFVSGSTAIQAHRVAKNRDTDIALLDAVSEEINNSIFRRGHVRVGISSALIGSGMAFDFKWFAQNVKLLNTAGEDKELEVLLLKQGVYVDFLNWTYVYDEKTRKEADFSKQRRRWLGAQFDILKSSIHDLPFAIRTKNWDYLDKLIQWMMLPRIVVMGLTFLFAIGMLFINWTWSIKWWIIFVVLLYSFAMAIPDFLVDKKLKKTFRKLPIVFLIMIYNMFRIKGVNSHFIHTVKKS